MTDELDSLLKELKRDSEERGHIEPQPLPPLPELNDENINQYVLDNAAKLVQLGLLSVQSIKDSISQGGDAEEIESYASLIRSVNDTINTVNKINIQNKKSEVSKQLKEMDLQRQLPPQHQTNVLIATREEIMQRLINGIASNTNNQTPQNDNNAIDITVDSEN